MRSPWPTIPAGEVARIEIGGTPARNSPALWARGDAGHPWVSIADMREAVVSNTSERITEIGVRSSNVKPVPAGTPLMSFKLTVGRVAIAGTDLFTNEAIAAFHVDGSKVSRRWLLHVLPRAASKLVTDTAVKGSTLNKTKLHGMPLELPPILEQRRIAEILDTLDEAIRKTEQVIAKLQQMKRGLLNDLLTRGIDENGELRDAEQHPEQFKDSPLGRIPRGWEVGHLDDVVDPRRPVVYGILMPGRGVPGGVPVVKVKDIKDGRINEDELLLTSRAIDEEYRRSRLRPGDLLFTIRGTVGRMALVPATLDGANITQDTARLAITGADVAFVRQYLRMPIPQAYIETHTIGQAVKGINLRELRRVPLALPPVEEQRRLGRELAVADERVAHETHQARKLDTLKHGLMEDLLTGRVRVTTSEAS